MKTHVISTAMAGLVIVEIEYPQDERGFFLESWNRRVFAEAGLDVDFVQDNHSRSMYRVLRGLHYQDMTAPIGKLVRCTFGAILDVAVDLRVSSPTFGHWLGVELTADNKKQFYLPIGFAHGFVALSEYAEVQYKQTGYYTPAAEDCLAWNDPDVGIQWTIKDPILSKKDKNGMSLREYQRNPAFK